MVFNLVLFSSSSYLSYFQYLLIGLRQGLYHCYLVPGRREGMRIVMDCAKAEACIGLYSSWVVFVCTYTPIMIRYLAKIYSEYSLFWSLCIDIQY